MGSTTGGARRRTRRKASELLGRGPVAPGSPLPADDADLALPHERDESTGSASTGRMDQGTAGMDQRELMQRAAADLAEGQVDTDLHATPGLDAERREELLKDAPSPRARAAQRKR